MKKLPRIFSLLIVLCLLLPLCAHAEESAEQDWYLEKAAILTGRLYELISFEGLVEVYTSQEEVISLIGSWRTAMESEPVSVKGYDLPPVELISEFTPEMKNIPAVLLEKIERSMASLLVSQINGMMGVNFLAASTIPTLSEGYIMPEGFRPCVILYEYENICVSVSFTQIGEQVVSATVQFASPQIIQLLQEAANMEAVS